MLAITGALRNTATDTLDVTSCKHSCDLADKLPASSRSHCHFHSHSKIPGTYVSRSDTWMHPQ